MWWLEENDDEYCEFLVLVPTNGDAWKDDVGVIMHKIAMMDDLSIVWNMICFFIEFWRQAESRIDKEKCLCQYGFVYCISIEMEDIVASSLAS